MAVRSSAYEIPTEFLPFDTNVTTQGEFLNVRDLQKLRANHNALIAKRSRRVLWSFSQRHSHSTVRPASKESGEMMFRISLPISATCESVTVVGTASRTLGTLSGDVDLFWTLEGPTETMRLSDSYKWVCAVADAKKTVTLPVSNNAREGRRAVLSAYVDGAEGGAPAAALAILAVGPRWIDVAGVLGFAFPLAMHFPTNLGIEPRHIVATQAIAGGNTRIWLEEPFNVAPDEVVDTWSTTRAAGVATRGVVAYEDLSTVFGSGLEVP